MNAGISTQEPGLRGMVIYMQESVVVVRSELTGEVRGFSFSS